MTHSIHFMTLVSFYIPGKLKIPEISECFGGYKPVAFIKTSGIYESGIFKRPVARYGSNNRCFLCHRQPQKVVYKNSVLKNISKFTGKHPC